MDTGAHFHKCDFQVHSPRDRRWKGEGAVTEDERKQYAASLIADCRKKEIDAIAITDHNDLVFVKYVRIAAGDEVDNNGVEVGEAERIVVFPGLELTLNVPCQALVIFDSDFPDDLFQLVLNALAIIPSPGSDAKTAETKRLDQITTLDDLRHELDKHSYLKGRYIVLPNVSDGGSHTLLRTGNSAKYAAMPCVGGYTDGATSKLGEGNRRIIDGKDGSYGNKRIAVFQTSDSRNADHSELGTSVTWVKWAVPTAEALRQACLAQESRISHSIPNLPSVVITGMSVSNSVYLGPINLELNAQYNALIGGRGTGKSTLLEYLRWALCDQPVELLDTDDLPNFQARRNTLIEKTLRALKANVEVSFSVNGISHVVRRFSDTGSTHLKVADGEFQPCRDSDIRELLPIQAYSQKQLSNVSVRIDELFRFIEAPIRAKLDGLEAQFERAAGEIRQEYAALSRKRRLVKQVEKDEIQLISLEQQATNIRAGVTGITEADSAILGEKVQRDRDESVVRTHTEDLRSVSALLKGLQNGLQNLPTDTKVDTSGSPNAELLKSIGNEINGLIEEIKIGTASLLASSSQKISSEGIFSGSLKKNLDAWKISKDGFEKSYSDAKSRATAHEQQLKELTRIEVSLEEIKKRNSATKRDIASMGEPEIRSLDLRKQWVVLHNQRSKLLNDECKALTSRSQEQIRASLSKGIETSKIEEALRSAITGSGIRRDKIDSIFESVRQAEKPIERWLVVLSELEMLALTDVGDQMDSEVPDSPLLSAANFSNQDLKKIAGRLDMDTWLHLSLTRIEDKPQFEFAVREAEYIPFENASAGQQATALLKTLLNQPGPPLIIDQPEEDLDNPVILEVVQQIWKAKQGRQIIFASHNANLVVNGDAELVVWCDNIAAADHSRGRVRGQGAIDIPDICNAIKAVMEGGEAAFKLRRDKYGF